MRVRDVFVGLVRLYQRIVSPYFGNRCRFHPSCSEYMAMSIRKNGSFFGILDGVGRLLRCHPFHPGGVDWPREIRSAGSGGRWKKD